MKGLLLYDGNWSVCQGVVERSFAKQFVLNGHLHW